MQSARPKVLHALAGRSMLAHCMDSVEAAGVDRIAVVVGPGHEAVAAEAKAVSPGAAVFVQTERRGTAHAVLAAEAAIAEGYDYILVVFADTPLIKSETLRLLRWRAHETQAAVAALGFEARDPAGYGRFLMEGQKLLAIREEKDASPEELRLTLVNAGLMALDGRTALDLLKQIDTNNAKGEFYLTDVVAAAAAQGLPSTVAIAAEEEVLGVNDRVQLAHAEAVLQTRLREYAMRGGATLIDPASVTLAYDTVLGRDVTVEPHVVFAPGVRAGDGVTIRSFSHLEGVTIGPRAIVGPFARLRPGSVLHEDVHVGNFVEIKASTLEAGVKANHLSYIGDATVGAKTNIGAGTITCNYNGFQKFRTEIGAGAFIGVHSALVAPVTIGDGAYIGTGSVVTRDVAPDALVVARAPQVEKPGWAKVFRDKNKR
jgi:bifunctional UDP-N-acetylglucosamine pyrophosphorylase/glucosamine-1-phosphate N-acetyltransferase